MQSKSSVPLLSVEDLRIAVGQRGHQKEAVRGISFDLGSGQTFGIVGESGSGKTLTVLAISRLLPSAAQVTSGKVYFKGEDLIRASSTRLAEIRGRQISVVFQDSLTSLNPVMRIGTQVREPLLLHRLADRQDANAAAEEELRRLGIPDPSRAMTGYPHEFSGGMRQRAMIAGALIASPELIIADEPTTALDATVQAQIIDIWSTLNSELGVALILVSHDLGVVSEVCDTVAVMYAGQIVETGPTRLLLSNAKHPYTEALLESMPSATTIGTYRLKAIPGEPPMLGALPSGCPFHSRCRYRQEICVSREPRLEQVGDRKVACWVAQERGELPAATAKVADAPRTPHSASAITSGALFKERPTKELLILDKVTCHHLMPNRWPFLPPARVHALDDVSLTVQKGEVLGVAGESGCGKSTLARCVLRLTDIDEGRIVFRGEEISSLGGEALRHVRRHMQPVLQDPYGSLNPRARVTEIVEEPLLAHGIEQKQRQDRVAEVLDLVGLGIRFGRHLPHQLSGGQRQRVGIARAIALNPELIVADEPISALDVSIQAQILNLFRDLQRQLNLSLIFISHDLRIVRYLSSNIAIMFLGQIVEYGSGEDICEAPLHPYTVALLSSVPVMEERAGRQRIVLSGEPPSPISPPSGCRFRTRCPYAAAICAEIAPELQQMPSGRRVACHFPGVSGTPNGGERGPRLAAN